MKQYLGQNSNLITEKRLQMAATLPLAKTATVANLRSFNDLRAPVLASVMSDHIVSDPYFRVHPGVLPPGGEN